MHNVVHAELWHWAHRNLIRCKWPRKVARHRQLSGIRNASEAQFGSAGDLIGLILSCCSGLPCNGELPRHSGGIRLERTHHAVHSIFLDLQVVFEVRSSFFYPFVSQESCGVIGIGHLQCIGDRSTALHIVTRDRKKRKELWTDKSREMRQLTIDDIGNKHPDHFYSY